MRKYLIIIFSCLSLIACGDDASSDYSDNKYTLPPLTYTHKFNKCPFEVRFPDEPEEKIEEQSREHINGQYNYINVYATCFFPPEDWTKPFTNREMAEAYVRSLKKRGTMKSVEGFELEIKPHDKAQMKFLAIGNQDNEDYYVAGVIYAHENSVLVIATTESDGRPDIRKLTTILETVIITDSAFDPAN